MTRAISIHAPRVGRDTSGCRRTWRPQKFQSTRPVWGATFLRLQDIARALISIHAPRVGRDVRPRLAHTVAERISIHAPRVGRDCVAQDVRRHGKISIHAPRVGRDAAAACTIAARSISIHAPRVGRDTNETPKTHSTHEFQSTRPVWGATDAARGQAVYQEFQSTRPVWGATWRSAMPPGGR